MSDSDKVISTTVMAAIAIIAGRSFASQQGLPAPHDMLSTATAYTMLFILGGFAPKLAAALGVGLLIAVAMNLFQSLQWRPIGFKLPPGSSIGTFGPNGVGQPGTSGLTVPGGNRSTLPPGGPGIGTPPVGTGGLSAPGNSGVSIPPGAYFGGSGPGPGWGNIPLG